MPTPQLQYAPPILEAGVILPKDIWAAATPGHYIVEFPREFAGFVEFDIHAGAANSTVVAIYGERLTPDRRAVDPNRSDIFAIGFYAALRSSF